MTVFGNMMGKGLALYKNEEGAKEDVIELKVKKKVKM